MAETTHTLQLDADLRADFETEILRHVKAAVEDKADLDSLLAEYADAIDGLNTTQSAARWKNSCDLTVPLTYKAFVNILAQFVQSIKRDPLVTIEAIVGEDEGNATEQESFLASKATEIELREKLATVAEFALKYGVGILHHGWKVETTYNRTFRQIDSEGNEVAEPEQEAEQEYTDVPQVEEEHKESLELRPVHPADFYLYPANAKNIAQALGCGERLMLTAHELLLGIDAMGFAEEAVMSLLQQGAGSGRANEIKRNKDESHGVANSGGKDDLFECYLWYCRTPVLMDEAGIRTPDDILHDDLMVVVCPAHDAVLRMGFSPYKERPYEAYYALKDEENFVGRSLPQILEGLQKEANAEIQAYIDGMNIRSSPAFKRKASSRSTNDNFQFFPGAIFEFDNDPNELTPFEMPPPPPEPLAALRMIDEQANEITTAGGYGRLENKVRKNGESQAIQQAAASKFDLMIWYFAHSLVKTFQRISALCAEHMDEDGEEFLDDLDHRKKITKAQLRGRYLYKATIAAPGATPEMRLQMAQMADGVATKYIQAEMSGMRLEQLKRVWHSSRQILIDAGVHNPESYIGKEPTPESMAANMPQGAPQNGQQLGSVAMGQPQLAIASGQ